MRARNLCLALSSLTLLAAGPAAAAAHPEPAQAKQTALVNRLLVPAAQPAAAGLGSHCSDPWWELSGIQWATCMYLRSRQK